MEVKILEIHSYPQEGQAGESARIMNPSWSEIENSIRLLDRSVFPFVWLYKSTKAQEGDIPDFEIIGGRGAFAIAGKSRSEDAQKFYSCGSKSSATIEIWESDQGATIPVRNACFDIEIVLQLTRYFCENGLLPNSCEWSNI